MNTKLSTVLWLTVILAALVAVAVYVSPGATRARGEASLQLAAAHAVRTDTAISVWALLALGVAVVVLAALLVAVVGAGAWVAYQYYQRHSADGVTQRRPVRTE